MPYPNEHSCRLEDPDKYDRFNRVECDQKHEGKCIDVIYGIKNNKSEIQALRYKTDIWDEDDARAHCKSRGGSFEAAKKEESNAMNKGKEIRTYDLDSLEIRTDEGDENPKIKGHAAVFNKKSVDLGGFTEVIEPGAFKDAVKRDDVRALFNHDPNYILGRSKGKSPTLTLEEDERGLYFEIDPPDTQYSKDLIISIERGDISQCSFAFNIDGKKGERWEVDGEEADFDKVVEAYFDSKKHDIVRYVVKVKPLYDVSPVTYAAYTQTDVKSRSLMMATGIDYDAVSAAAMKAERGETLNEDEKTIITKASERLRSYTPQENPDVDGDRDGSETCVEKMRRQLELLEIE